MFQSELTLGQHLIANTCLTFLILDGVQPDSDDDSDPRRLAQIYCLETGTVHWPDVPGRNPLSLRESGRLAEWEPMTDAKFAVIAADSGVAGPAVNAPGRIKFPETAVVVVSPQGFLMCWEPGFMHTSDVARLADVHQPLANRHDGWDEYYRTYTDDKGHIVAGPGFHGFPAPQAWVGNGRTPMPEGINDFEVETLAGCNRMAISPLDLSGNDAYGTYTHPAADFVRQHFGVNPLTVDWQAAAGARIVNAQFANTAPFTPASARAALRQALTRNSPTRLPQASLIRRKPARAQIERRLPRRPTQ